jgi:hypothetical protein
MYEGFKMWKIHISNIFANAHWTIVLRVFTISLKNSSFMYNVLFMLIHVF